MRVLSRTRWSAELRVVRWAKGIHEYFIANYMRSSKRRSFKKYRSIFYKSTEFPRNLCFNGLFLFSGTIAKENNLLDINLRLAAGTCMHLFKYWWNLIHKRDMRKVLKYCNFKNIKSAKRDSINTSSTMERILKRWHFAVTKTLSVPNYSHWGICIVNIDKYICPRLSIIGPIIN